MEKGDGNCTAQPDKMGVAFTQTVALPEEVKAALFKQQLYLPYCSLARKVFREKHQCVLVP